MESRKAVEPRMPWVLKLLIGLTAVQMAFIVAMVLISAFGRQPFADGGREPVEIRMVPVEDPRMRPSSTSPTTDARIEIPPEYQTRDQTPRPWVVRPDGSVRFIDAER